MARGWWYTKLSAIGFRSCLLSQGHAPCIIIRSDSMGSLRVSTSYQHLSFLTLLAFELNVFCDFVFILLFSFLFVVFALFLVFSFFLLSLSFL